MTTIQRRLSSAKEQQATSFDKSIDQLLDLFCDEIRLELKNTMTEKEEELANGKGKEVIQHFIEFKMVGFKQKFMKNV